MTIYSHVDTNATSQVTSGANITNNSVVRGDGGSKGIQGSTVFISNAGEMTNASQPSFLAYLAANDSNKTGNGTVYVFGDTDTETALTEVYDQNSDFVPGASGGATFTAPVTGKYLLTLQATVTGLTTATEITPRIVTSNRTYSRKTSLASTSGTVSMNISVIADMDALDTATYDVAVLGDGADNGDILGTAELRNNVSGCLLA